MGGRTHTQGQSFLAAHVLRACPGCAQGKGSSGGGGEGDEGGGGGLFSGDGTGRPSPSGGSKVYSGGARSGKVRPPPSGKLKGSALSKVQRAGKGKHGFKSKARHKRR